MKKMSTARTFAVWPRWKIYSYRMELKIIIIIIIP